MRPCSIRSAMGCVRIAQHAADPDLALCSCQWTQPQKARGQRASSGCDQPVFGAHAPVLGAAVAALTDGESQRSHAYPSSTSLTILCPFHLRGDKKGAVPLSGGRFPRADSCERYLLRQVAQTGHDKRGISVRADDVRLADDILARFSDTASTRFDDSLAAMPLDDAQRRELRYWQRQSLAAFRQYAAVALPGALAAVAAAESEALASLEAAGLTWTETRAQTTSIRMLVEMPAEPSEQPPQAEEPDSLELRRRTVAARLASGA